MSNDPEPRNDHPSFYNSLELSLTKAWQLMEDAVTNRRNAFRVFSVATVTPDGLPNVRSVVLRGADRSARQITFHTDIRSGKFIDFDHQSNVMAQFYSPPERIQLRLTGTAFPRKERMIIERKWADMAIYSKQCYRQPVGPGVAMDDPYEAETDLLELDAATGNLCPVEIKVDRLEWLFLSSAGHRRAVFDFAENPMRANWLAP